MTDAEQTTFLADQATTTVSPRDIKLEALASYRYLVQNSGTTVAGVPLDTDPDSRAALTAAYVAALQNSAFTVDWKGSDGSFYPLTAAAVISVGNAVLAFVSKCFAVEGAVTANVDSYADIAAVKAAFDAGMVAV